MTFRMLRDLSASSRRAQISRDADVSNPFRSTFQSPGLRTWRRIDRNPRVCARFAIELGPREQLFLCNSLNLANFSLGAICLGPRIIALDSLAIGNSYGDQTQHRSLDSRQPRTSTARPLRWILSSRAQGRRLTTAKLLAGVLPFLRQMVSSVGRGRRKSSWRPVVPDRMSHGLVECH